MIEEFNRSRFRIVHNENRRVRFRHNKQALGNRGYHPKLFQRSSRRAGLIEGVQFTAHDFSGACCGQI